MCILVLVMEKKAKHMFDKVKSITLEVTLLFPITELVIHINIAFYSMKESGVCCRKNNLLTEDS